MAEFRLSVPVEVRFRDTDAMGHVNNAVYMTFLEVARERYWRDVMKIAAYTDCGLILARTEIDFRSPAFVGETLHVSLRVSRLGTTSFDFRYEVREPASGRLVAEAVSVQVMYDYETRRKRPLTGSERQAILGFEAVVEP